MGKKECTLCLQEAAEKIGKPPRKADMSPEEVQEIKRFLGAWPRALEAAGLKPVSKRKQVQKRIRRECKKIE